MKIAASGDHTVSFTTNKYVVMVNNAFVIKAFKYNQPYNKECSKKDEAYGVLTQCSDRTMTTLYSIKRPN